MSNHIQIGDNQYPLTDQQAEAIAAAIRETAKQKAKESKLAEIPVGEIAKIVGVEFVVLEHVDGETTLISKDFIAEESAFSGSKNNYAGSYVDDACESFAEMLEDLLGSDNVVEFNVDLTSNDGLKDYGQIRRKASLMTADLYRRYVEILDNHNPGEWWWLATPWSTKRHDSDSLVLCVSPSGRISNVNYYGVGGVRPFCILKSDIFVSC